MTSLGTSTVTLTSSKGNCAVVSGVFTCAATVTKPMIFTVINGNLAYRGNTTFFTTAIPTGQVQAKVETTNDLVPFTIGWKSS